MISTTQGCLARTERVLAFIVIMSALYSVVGCVKPTQDAWHQQLCGALNSVSEAAREDGTRLAKEQLVVNAGTPDHAMSAPDLADLLRESAPGSPHYRDAIMDKVWRAYVASVTTDEPESDWRTSTGFATCQLLLYDERLRFSKPLPHGLGYQAYYFLLRDNRVLCGGVIIPWHPAEVLPH